TVTGTNSAGCQNTQTVSVTVNALPTVGANPVSNPICKGSPTTITASGASTYTWAPSTGLSVTTGTNVSANPSSAITYTVTGTDVNGCISTVTVAMGVNSLPVVTANASPTSICAGNSSSISGGGAINYVWSPAATLTSSTGTVVGASPTTTTAYTVTGTDGNGCSNIANVVVNVDNPNINFTQANVSCNGACNGTLLANVSGGTPPYNYSWSNSQTSALASNLCPATYKLTLTDNFGCSSSKTATITQPSAITLNVSSAATTCGLANGSATATPSGGSAPYNYSWNTKPAQTTSVANGLAAGTYSITVTDGNGCTAIKSVTVNGSSGPSISSTQITQSSCGVNDGKATITVTGGVLPYTYSWNNGDTIATDSNLAAGTYIATVTDKNGCSTFGAVIINDASGPVISVNSVTNINCYGASSGAISTSVTGGQSPYFYSWSNSATTQNINGLTAGPYQFTVSDANGCTAVQNINITQPSELITSTNTSAASCGSSDGSVSVTVSGGTTPYSYLWNNSTTNSSISNVGAGTYSVTVTDNNGCTSVADASISNASGPLVTIDSVVDINCSSGATGEITIAANGGTPPYTYLWSNGDTTANLYNVAAGEYALTVTDASGCAGTANATITQSQISPIAICMATVDPATNYNNLSWDASNFTGGIVACNIYKETTTPGVFNKIGSVSAAKGLYVDTLSDARKRSWRYEISEVDSCGVESPLSAPFKTMHLTINLGASNAINLIWDNFQGINFNYYIVYRDSVAGIASDSIDYVTNNGIYTYTDYPPLTGSWYYHMGISSSGACASVIHPHSIEAINYNASKSNTGTVTFGPTGIPNVSSPGSLDIYPNPTRGVFNMSLVLNSQQNVDIKIYNTLGQVIKEETYGQSYGKAIKQFDMSAYGKGVYFVKVTTNNDVQYRKVVIQ
ncbi:MAG TPA: T9SS type A sorting domain-containing protein, partial [Bacteroidia bacterium]|nr:T9SS type A sorting domain-containing protein [Bacteroidia bacterium]